MDIDTVAILARRLFGIPILIRAAERHGQSPEAEAWQIPTGLGTFDDSATELTEFSGDLVPKAVANGEEPDDLLNEIGEATPGAIVKAKRFAAKPSRRTLTT